MVKTTTKNDENRSKNMKKNNLKIIIAFLLVMLFSLNNIFVNAEEVVDENIEDNVNETIDTSNLDLIYVNETETEYKFSENNDIYLPFLILSSDKVEIDKEVSNLGIVCGTSGIDVLSETENVQILISNDTIRVSNNMEYAVLLTNGNVIIDSDISKTLIVFANEKVTITENSTVSGDVICFSNSLEIKGNVSGNVIGNASTATITGKIEKDFRIVINSLELSDNSVLGNIYIETENSEITNEKYPTATIKFVDNTESTKDKILDIILDAVKVALVYTLLYLIVFKASKEKLFSNLLSVVKKNVGFTVMGGTIAIIATPLAILVTVLGYFIGIKEIVLPFIILYLAFIISVSLLSTFVIGSLLLEYVIDNHLFGADLTRRLVTAFFVFLSLTLLTNIPTVGVYISMIYIILAIGIVICYLKKKNELVTKRKK